MIAAKMPRTNGQTPRTGKVVIMITTLKINELHQRLIEFGAEIIAPPVRLWKSQIATAFTSFMKRHPNRVRVTFAQHGEIE